jgi:hypothetical protein
VHIIDLVLNTYLDINQRFSWKNNEAKPEKNSFLWLLICIWN